MRKSPYLTTSMSLSLLLLVSGCAAHQTSPFYSNLTSKTDFAKSTTKPPKPTITDVKQENAPATPPKLTISATTKTSSQEVFTFNQSIKDAQVVSGIPSVLINKTNTSVTIRRLTTTTQMIGIMVTPESGSKQLMTLNVPKSTVAPSKTQKTNPTSSSRSSPSATSSIKEVNGTPVPLIYFGPSSGRRIYITIDDGWFPSQTVLHLMQTQHVPITTFLIQKAAEEHLQYWKDFVKAGGVIQDHTVSHPYLTKVSYQDDLTQWEGPMKTYPKWFGQTPTLARPPYGAVNKNVRIAAHNAGLKDVVMWSADFDPTDPSKGLQTWNHKPLSPGEIVILHWDPGVYQEIEKVLSICKTRNLVPAPLVLPNSTTDAKSKSSGTKSTTTTPNTPGSASSSSQSTTGAVHKKSSSTPQATSIGSEAVSKPQKANTGTTSTSQSTSHQTTTGLKGSQASGGNVTISVTNSHPTTSASNYANEIALMKNKGYSVKGNSTTPSATVKTASGNTLTAWITVATKSQDGHNQLVFFFLNGRYLGTDTAQPSVSITSAKAVGHGIAVTYPVYRENDSFANPTGTPVTITYTWNGSKLVPNKPYPKQFIS